MEIIDDIGLTTGNLNKEAVFTYILVFTVFLVSVQLYVGV